MSKTTITVKRAEKIFPDTEIPEITLKTDERPLSGDAESFFYGEAQKIIRFLETLHPKAPLAR